MKWHYVILVFSVLAAAAIAVGRLTHTLSHGVIQAVVTLCVLMIIFAVIKFLGKLRE